MDVAEIIEEFEEILRESETMPWGNSEILYSAAVDALRQQQLEIERLQGHLAVEARIRLELVESSKLKQAKIAELKNSRDYWCLQYKDVMSKLDNMAGELMSLENSIRFEAGYGHN